MSGFPLRRLRRLRSTPALRSLVRETRLSPADLIAPVFVVEDAQAAGPVESMPGVNRHTLATLPREIEQISQCGLQAVLIFGVPRNKDRSASAAYGEDNVVAKAVASCKATNPELVVITDVCLCSYMDHGHCGVVREEVVDNDATLELLGQMAVSHAQAGADLVAPSGMMDGMVGAIRSALDASKRTNTGILSYTVKYASAFYGPFRDAAESAPQFGDRRSYQMDPANAREAIAEAAQDVEQGADVLMVKPAMPYLDVIRGVREAFPQIPIAAYQVSGEYSMIRAAAQHGWLDERAVVMEALTAIKRAGASVTITYFAKDASRWLAAR